MCLCTGASSTVQHTSSNTERRIFLSCHSITSPLRWLVVILVICVWKGYATNLDTQCKKCDPLDCKMKYIHVGNIYSNHGLWLRMVGVCVHVYTGTDTTLYMCLQTLCMCE